MRPIRFFLLAVFVILFTGCASQSGALSYLALGDSYTIGESVPENERWPVQLADTLRDEGIEIHEPQIIATTGWTTTELQKAMDNSNLNDAYHLVSLLIGVNDQYDGLDFDAYPGRFEALLKRAIALAGDRPRHVFVVSIPDYSVTPFGQEMDAGKISRELDAYNAVNRSIADSLNVSYINITPGSRDAADDPTLIADDGLHPSGKMYDAWVRKIVPVLLPEIRSWK